MKTKTKTRNALCGLLSGLLLLAAGTAQTHAALLAPAGPGSELYVANQGNNTNSNVVKLTPGGVGSVFSSGVQSARCMAFDTAGNLYVSNIDPNTITKITPSGSRSVFASAISGLSLPENLAFDSTGSLYVASRGMGILPMLPPWAGRPCHAPCRSCPQTG